MSDEPEDDQPKPWYARPVLRTDRPPGLGDPRLRAQFLKKLPPPWVIRWQPSHLRMQASHVAQAMAEKHPKQCPLPDNIRLAKLMKALSRKGINCPDSLPSRTDKRKFLIGGPWRKLFRQLWPSAPFYKVQDRVRVAGPYFTFCQLMCFHRDYEQPKDVRELRACQMAVNRLNKGSTKKDTTFKSLT